MPSIRASEASSAAPAAPAPRPDWLTNLPPPEDRDAFGPDDVRQALASTVRSPRDMRIFLSPAADAFLEPMAQQAEEMTRRHFGRTISLYAPLYLSNHCTGGCAYCGFASDRSIPRKRLSFAEVDAEVTAMRRMGLDEILLLTGERGPHADYDYLCECVRRAARQCDAVTVEAFAMDTEEYEGLVAAGCVGVTLYQETYDPLPYARFHRWGPKRDYSRRLDAPERILRAGMRQVGIGALFGLRDPWTEAFDLYSHAVHLRRSFWRGGVSISFPRLRPEYGGFTAPFPVTDRDLARIIVAFRLMLPDVHLVLSTRESPAFRDGMAGLGISKMSVASRTTVGGYAAEQADTPGQFTLSDERDVVEFSAALRRRGLDPVFKNWDGVFCEA